MGAVRMPTLPRIDLGFEAADRGALLAGLRFVEGVASGWTLEELRAWIAQEMVAPGRMTAVSVVQEAAVGSIALDPATSAAAERVGTLDDLPKLLAMSRSRVVVTLRAFIGTPPDDRFLQAAIYQERVQRVSTDRGAIWVARPLEKDLLADVVLSLFAADILMYRDFHQACLCVCGVCGRVSFAPAVTSQSGCAEHPARSDGVSGVRRTESATIAVPASRK